MLSPATNNSHALGPDLETKPRNTRFPIVNKPAIAGVLMAMEINNHTSFSRRMHNDITFKDFATIVV